MESNQEASLLHLGDPQANSWVRGLGGGGCRASRKTRWLRLLARLGGRADLYFRSYPGGGRYLRRIAGQAPLPGFPAARQNICDHAHGISSCAGLAMPRGIDRRQNEFRAFHSRRPTVCTAATAIQKKEQRSMKLQLRLVLALSVCAFLASSAFA